MTVRWTIERVVNSAQESETVAWSTFAARKAMLAEMAVLGLTVAPSLRTLADEQSSFWFVRDPDAPARTYVRVVAERIDQPEGIVP